MLTKINSEDPKADQWKLIGQFSYPTNIERYLQGLGLTPTKEAVDYISGSVRQSEAYFIASESSPLDISPLLLYYAATNLLYGAVALLTGAKPNIQHHGMNFILAAKPHPRIADYEIKPINPRTGALQQVLNVLAAGCFLTNGSKWSVEELFGSIPDLIQEFENCYQPSLPFCVPASTVSAELHGISFSYDRVEMSILEKYPNHYDAVTSIADCKETYLTPRYNVPSQYVNLFFKEQPKDSSIYSIFGQKYLPLVHIKDGKPLSPPLVILMFMGLYALGYLSRYYPAQWNAFVRTDESGERLVVEKFISVCQRYFPNLVLNEIKKCRVQFVRDIS
jgi:hypothetical protein